MKKFVGRIYRWILLSIIVQLVVLMFLNNRLTSDGNYKFTSMELTGDINNSIETKLPAKAGNIKVSHDGTYVAYMLDGKLEINDLVANQAIKSITGKDGAITYYKWLPDRNMVIYSTNVSTAYSGRIKLKTYEIDTGIEREYPVIKNLSRSCKVDAIELSTFTKVLYIKISNNQNRAVIYKFDIMNNLSWIMESGSNTVVYEANLSDILFYQKVKDDMAYRDGSDGSRKVLDFGGDITLLGADADDRVYVGELNSGNTIKAIRYGKVNEPVSTWKTEKLDKPAAAGRLYITRNGSIYLLSADQKNIKNIISGKKTSLKGKIVDVINGYIAMADGEKFILDELK